MWNKILDASIYFSFDKSGFLRHSKCFDEALYFEPNANAIVTGGTSGIGLATATELAEKGVNVIITGRDSKKGEETAKKNKHFQFLNWDMADWDKVKKVVEELPVVQQVVLNAGGMPERFTTNSRGVEMQFASQLFGHFYLLQELQRQRKLKSGAKIVWVSSGGMYLSKLNTEKIFKDEKYDKVATYANVKRSQISLLPFFKSEFSEHTVTAMHPGWVATPGISSAIPKFEKFMAHRLRHPRQGADTILWLLGTQKAIESGGFYFDRKQVATDFFRFTRASDQQIKSLIDTLKTYAPADGASHVNEL